MTNHALRLRRGAAVALGAMLVIWGAAAPAGAVTLEDPKFQVVETDGRAGLGSVGGLALFLRVGTTELTVGRLDGVTAFDQLDKKVFKPVVPDDLLVNKDASITSGPKCGGNPDAIQLAGTAKCLDRAKLQARLPGISDTQVTILEATLFSAGITQRVLDPAQSGVSFREPLGLQFPQPPGIPAALALAQLGDANPQGRSKATGVLIPNLAKAEANCDATSSGAQAAEESKVGLTIPVALNPVIAGDIAYANCSITRANARGGEDFPQLRQESGEARLDVKLNQTLVSNVPAVNQVLDTLAGAAPEPVKNAVRVIRENLNAAPIVKARVAPGTGTIQNSINGVVSTSETGDVVIDVLNGLAVIKVGRAKAFAAALKDRADASAECALVEAKVLNLLTPDPNDFLADVAVPCPSQRVELLGGLPAPIGDALKITIEAGKKDPVTPTSPPCIPVAGGNQCTASAEAKVLSINMFNSPLIPITLELANANAFAQARPPIAGGGPVLPLTGAMPFATMASGITLVGAGLWLRRRFLG